MGLVLDVGCGLNPRGDWNLDKYLDSTHRRRGQGPDLDPSNIQNFVKADMCDMYMFKNKQFAWVRCHQTLEHEFDWRTALRELWRVTGKHLTVEVPSRYYLPFPQATRSIHHISNFDAATMRKAVPIILKTRNFEVTSIKRGMFHPLIPFPLWPHIVRLDVYR